MAPYLANFRTCSFRRIFTDHLQLSKLSRELKHFKFRGQLDMNSYRGFFEVKLFIYRLFQALNLRNCL